jgi:hypothetical protein
VYQFNSSIVDRGEFVADWPAEIIKNEPMFFNCDLNFAFENGGPITEAFIRTLPEDWQDCNPVLDSRVHMLMKGWFPCIPGFHHSKFNIRLVQVVINIKESPGHRSI